MSREFSALIRQKSMEWQTSFSKAENTFQLEHDMLSDILVSVFEDVQEIAASFKVEMSKKQDIIALIEKANAALSTLSEKMIMINEAKAANKLPSFALLDKKDLSVHDAMQVVVHELRNPLTAIGGFAKKLERTLNPMSDEWQYAKVIVEEAARLEVAIDELTGRKK
jgi:nitrogen-specific signal transduction histidine kinase